MYCPHYKIFTKILQCIKVGGCDSTYFLHTHYHYIATLYYMYTVAIGIETRVHLKRFPLSHMYFAQTHFDHTTLWISHAHRNRNNYYTLNVYDIYSDFKGLSRFTIDSLFPCLPPLIHSYTPSLSTQLTVLYIVIIKLFSVLFIPPPIDF